jgi:hypothetical protein
VRQTHLARADRKPEARAGSAALDEPAPTNAALAKAVEQTLAAPSALVARLAATAGNSAVNLLMRQTPSETEPQPAPAAGGEQRPAWATEDFKRKFAATILAEAVVGQETDISWVYYNLILAHGAEGGLSKSSAYAKRKPWYKVWLHLLGDTTYGADALPKEKSFEGYTTVADYCTRNGWARTQADTRGKAVLDQFDRIVSAPESNPMAGFTGQGNLADLNNESNDDVYWTRTRAYLWLQQEDPTKPVYVKVIGTGRNRQVLFNADAIKAYWDANPPLPKDVPKYP